MNFFFKYRMPFSPPTLSIHTSLSDVRPKSGIHQLSSSKHPPPPPPPASGCPVTRSHALAHPRTNLHLGISPLFQVPLSSLCLKVASLDGLSKGPRNFEKRSYFAGFGATDPVLRLGVSREGRAPPPGPSCSRGGRTVRFPLRDFSLQQEST